jgi:hypothetical protein
VLHTNSTIGTLAPLNGTIVVGTDYLYPISEGFSTYWEWVPTPPAPLPTTMEGSPAASPPMNTTTDATADDTTATATAPPVEGGEEEQTTPTIPAPTPLLE